MRKTVYFKLKSFKRKVVYKMVEIFKDPRTGEMKMARRLNISLVDLRAMEIDTILNGCKIEKDGE